MPPHPLARWNSGLAWSTPRSNSGSRPGFTSIWAISRITGLPLLLAVSGAPTAEMVLGPAHNLIEQDRHRRQHADQGEQLGRPEALGILHRVVADAGDRDIELGQQHAEQHRRHAEAHAG